MADVPLPEPAYYQWRRRNMPWSLEFAFNSMCIATTNDSEVRTLHPGDQLHAHAAAVTAAKDARIKVLEDALRKACDDMEGWGLYAPEYFREKHDFVGDVEAARAALGDKND